MSRLEIMLNGDPFSRQNLNRILGEVARKFVPIYMHLFEEMSEVGLLMADDTHTRVHEVNRARKKGDLKSLDTHDESPNLQKKKKRMVWDALRAHLPWQYQKANRIDEDKEQHLTSCIHGYLKSAGHRVVIYRSHMGSAGNLLDVLLKNRRSGKEVTILADLSSSNLVRDKHVLGKVKITYAGCAAHARRPFFKYAMRDPHNCLEILDYFTYLFRLEKDFQCQPSKVLLQARQDPEKGSQFAWNRIIEICEEFVLKYSSTNPLGKGARYVLRHKDALTLHLTRTDLPISNNLTERLVRFERLNERNTYGCKTLEGRARMDVLRTVLTTAEFAKVDINMYLMKILISPEKDVENHPEKYTPAAIKAHFENDPVDRDLVERILYSDDLGQFVTPSSSITKKAARSRS